MSQKLVYLYYVAQTSLKTMRFEMERRLSQANPDYALNVTEYKLEERLKVSEDSQRREEMDLMDFNFTQMII